MNNYTDISKKSNAPTAWFKALTIAKDAFIDIAGLFQYIFGMKKHEYAPVWVGFQVIPDFKSYGQGFAQTRGHHYECFCLSLLSLP